MTAQHPYVLRVYDVLIVRFPADPIDQTIDDLQDAVLSRMETETPRGVILDISSVSIMDSFFARTISETAKMVKLMGAEPVVVGVQPAVAMTAAELGYDLGSIEKALTTDHALTMLGLSMEAR